MANTKRTSSSTKYDNVTKRTNMFAASFSNTVSGEQQEDEMDKKDAVTENTDNDENEEINPVSEDAGSQHEEEKTDKKGEKKSDKKPKKTESNSGDAKMMIEKLIGVRKEKTGISRTVYFEAENYEFAEQLANSAGVGLSKAVNELIKYAREQLK